MSAVKHWHPPTIHVLNLLMDAYDRIPGGELYGYGIIKETGYGAATVYPMLARFTIADWVLTRSEYRGDKRKSPKNRVTYYRINPRYAEQIREQLRARTHQEETDR